MRFSRVLLGGLAWLGVAVFGRATDANSVRVLSYNIHHGEGVDGRLDLVRIAKVISDSGADLVALQEVDQRARRTEGIDQAAELGRLTNLHAYFGKAMDYQGGAYGQALLSRWPLEDFAVHMLPNPVAREPRIAVEGLVRLLARDPRPTLLAGDFNAAPDSRPMTLLLGSFADAAAARPEPTIPAERPTRRIDFVLFRPIAQWSVVAVSVIAEPIASDHRPVLANLMLRP